MTVSEFAEPPKTPSDQGVQKIKRWPAQSADSRAQEGHEVIQVFSSTNYRHLCEDLKDQILEEVGKKKANEFHKQGVAYTYTPRSSID